MNASPSNPIAKTNTQPDSRNHSNSNLVDPFGRTINYLRLSVTDRCNLRCTYCMAEDMEFLPKSRILSIEELIHVARAFVELGTQKIRLTGGEPLVRNGIIDACHAISALPGLRELVMTTNGVLLSDYARPLVNAGVKRLNISIDSLKPERFKAMTRFGKLEDVIQGIDSARAAGFHRIKLNAVILSGQNDDEVLDLAQFAIERGVDISYIEEMPLGHISSHHRSDTQMTSARIRDTLATHYNLTPSSDSTGGPSRYWKLQGHSSRIGFISPISDNFCASCNRVRLTTEGQLLLCLGNEHAKDLRAIMRQHPNDLELLKRTIRDAIAIKPEKHHFDPNDTQILRFMSATGG